MRIEILGDPAGARVQFEHALQAQCSALSVALQVGAPSPDVSVVFPPTGPHWTTADKASTAYGHLAQARHGVLPVIDEALEASKLPGDIAQFNAFQSGLWKTAWTDGLVDEVLSLGWQRRRERRVFISYKRGDSGPVARQLHDALTDRGYVTFLDDVSIGKGLDFQRELRWWLTDADAMIVLATANFPKSQWCMEEINSAKSAGVGLLGVAWPHLPSDSIMEAIDSDQQLRLQASDFMAAARASSLPELTDEALTRVLAHTARQRAMSIRLRLEDLVPLATRMLLPAGGSLVPASAAGDFTFHDAMGDEHFIRLLPFRPDARAVHDAFSTSPPHIHTGCFYSECDELDPRARALRWLADGRMDPSTPPRRTRVWAYVGEKELT
jgi:hypothetical protein